MKPLPDEDADRGRDEREYEAAKPKNVHDDHRDGGSRLSGRGEGRGDDRPCRPSDIAELVGYVREDFRRSLCRIVLE